MQNNTNTNTQKNEKNQSISLATTMKNVKAFGAALFNKLRCRLRGMNFWLMALICFLCRNIILYPLGSLCALVIGTVWCIENWKTVRRFCSLIGGKAARPCQRRIPRHQQYLVRAGGRKAY